MARKTNTETSTANLGFEQKLWLTADKLRNNMDAAEYKHVVLGLIFLKYISDTFEEHRAKLLAGQGDYAGADAEDPDEYKAENVFWVPADASWSPSRACGTSAKQPERKAEVRMQKEEPQDLTSSFSLHTWPDAMVAIEHILPHENLLGFRGAYLETAQRLKALMADLHPLLTKRAEGRDISGLSAYEQ